MEESNQTRLDNEFKRHLQILRPYLMNLVEEDVIECCGAWIERLTRCGEREKQLRNKYIFNLCYQLSRGVIDEPFVCKPPEGELMPCNTDDVSEDSVVSEPWPGDSEAIMGAHGSTDTNVWVNPLEIQNSTSETEQCDIYSNHDQLEGSRENASADKTPVPSVSSKRVIIMPPQMSADDGDNTSTRVTMSRNIEKLPSSRKKDTPNTAHKAICRQRSIYTPMPPNTAEPDPSYDASERGGPDKVYDASERGGPDTVYDASERGGLDTVYQIRANNLITKLRAIKQQNMLLNNELIALKEEAFTSDTRKKFIVDARNKRTVSEEHIQVGINVGGINDRNRSLQNCGDNANAVFRLKKKLLDVQSSRNFLLEAVRSLERQLKDLEIQKIQEIEDLAVKFKVDLADAKSALNQDLLEVKKECAEKIEQMNACYGNKIKDMEEKSSKEMAEMAAIHEATLKEKDIAIKAKDEEISRLEEVIQEQCANLQSAVSRFLEKCTEGSGEALRSRAEQLERQLVRLERARARCARAYEARLANVHREKHLMECTMQLQLLRQRAQLSSEATDESQAELALAVTKLEGKYKEIVASIQAAAIKRRLQDQLSLEAILQTTCGIPAQVQQKTYIQQTLHPSAVPCLQRQQVFGSEAKVKQAAPTNIPPQMFPDRPQERSLSQEPCYNGLTNNAFQYQTAQTGSVRDGPADNGMSHTIMSPPGIGMQDYGFLGNFERTTLPQKDVGDGENQ